MVTVKEFVRIKIIEDGKTISRLSSGDDLWRMKNKWMSQVVGRVVDRKGKWYRETITILKPERSFTIVTNLWTCIEGTVQRSQNHAVQ